MLGGIRAAQSTWIGKVLTTLIFGVILVAFVIWGIGDPFRGASANIVAEVGDVPVSTAAYRQAYRTAFLRLQERAKRAVTAEEAHLIGLDAQVLSRLIADAALDDRAQTMDLALSDPAVAKSIRDDPSLAGAGGAFDRARFDGLLRQSGLTEAAFLGEQRRSTLRQELVEALIGGVEAPAAAVGLQHRSDSETRSVDMVALSGAAAGPVAAPGTVDLKTYYDDHKSAFTTPQYRRLVVLAMTPAALAKPDSVSDADAQALYDQVKAERFGSPEKRHITEVVAATEAAAAAVTKRVRVGETFEEAIKTEGLGDKLVDLGTVTRDAIFDHAVAEAAFGLPAGGTSDPVKGSFGSVVAHVEAIEPAVTQPLADVAPMLKAEVAASRAAANIKALHDRVEEARSSGKTLTEAGAAVGLETRTIDAVDAAGNARDGRPVEGLVDGPDLLRAAFASDIGIDNDTMSTSDGGTLWFEVAGIDAARQLTLDEARPKVEAVWREEQTARQLDKVAADLVKAIDAGTQTIEAAAASLGLPVDHVGNAKRAGATGLAPGVVASIFDVPVGAAGSAATGPAARTLFKVIDSVTPPLDLEEEATKQIAQRYTAGLQNDIVNDYLAGLRARLGTKVNQAAVQAASGAGS